MALAANAAGPTQVEGSKNNGSSSGNNRDKSKPKPPCLFCNEAHYPIHCTISIDKKWDIVYKQDRCHVCLRTGHRKADCRAKRKCNECAEAHHTALHRAEKKKSSSAGPTPAAASSSAPPRTSSSSTSGATGTTVSALIDNCFQLSTVSCKDKHVALMTATVWIEGQRVKLAAFILIDGCSQRTYIRSDFAEEAGLRVVGKERLAVQSFGSDQPGEMKLRRQFNFSLRGLFNRARAVTMTVVEDDIICPAPEYVKTKFAEDLQDSGLHLADQRFYETEVKSRQVDILIGMDYYYSIVENHTRVSPDGMRAVPSKFGWLLHGATTEFISNKSSITNSIFISSMMQDGFDENQSELKLTSSNARPPPPPDTFITLSAVATTDDEPDNSEQEAGATERCLDCRRIFHQMDSMGVGDISERAEDFDPLADYSTRIIRAKSGRMMAPLP